MIKGSCCCGSIKFELASPPSMMGTCHCSRCRKLGASALVFVEKTSFKLLAGSECIQRYQPEAPFKYIRTFCKVCGTALGDIFSENDSFPISVNCFDGDLSIRNQFHVFVGSKPSWYEICDTAEQFVENPT